MDHTFNDVVDEDDEVEVEEEDVCRSDEVVHVDGHIVRELEKQDTSLNDNMDLSEDEQVHILV